MPLGQPDPARNELASEPFIFGRVRTLLCEKFGVVFDSVRSESEFVLDLGIERADMDYLTLTLEDAFDVNISSEDSRQLVRVRDAVECVLSNQRQQHIPGA